MKYENITKNKNALPELPKVFSIYQIILCSIYFSHNNVLRRSLELIQMAFCKFSREKRYSMKCLLEIFSSLIFHNFYLQFIYGYDRQQLYFCIFNIHSKLTCLFFKNTLPQALVKQQLLYPKWLKIS